MSHNTRVVYPLEKNEQEKLVAYKCCFNPRARTGRDSTLVKMVCQASFRGTFREPLLSAAGEDGKSAERMRKPSIAAIANPPGNP